MADFDHTAIHDEDMRRRYDLLLRRSQWLANSLHQGHGPERKPIKVSYASDPEFNAFVTEADDQYQIQIAAGVPLLILVLFYKLFENPILLPEVDGAGSSVSNVSLPFIIDPLKVDQREEWRIEISKPRALVARMLADICTNFVVTHELGHVLSGHVEGARFHEGNASYVEMLSTRPKLPEALERRQAWELDADSIASTLLLDHIGGLEALSRNDEKVMESFFREEGTRVHILSMTIAALLALFSYIRGTRYRLKLQTSHPHPMIRAFHAKNALVTASRDRWSVNVEELLPLMDERLEEMLEVLHVLGLSNSAAFTDQYIEQLDAEQDRITSLQKTYRQSCAEWSWITWRRADFSNPD